MCGIAGIISSDTLLVNRDNLKKMTDAVAHRGPDGEGYWISPSHTVGLGHRRLSIIDLSESASQPMHYFDRYTIVYNGEIYNYIELKILLQKKGYHFKTKSDTEVILAAYDYWKEDCLEQFDGMFALAIFDRREQILFAARDRFGEKPFYYYKNDTGFFFASEMKALWAAGIKKVINEKMLLNYLTIGYVQNTLNKDETFFENIFSLRPSNYLKLSVTNNHFVIKPYWHLDKENTIAISSTDAIEKFTSLFALSVKKRLRSDVVIGTSLSGGMDSSTIIATIDELYNIGHADYKPATFSAVFPGFKNDESSFIQSVVSKFHVQNFSTQPMADGLIKDFEKLCYHQEEPFPSSSIYAQYKVFELAKQHNVKVLLDGQGADETLAGYNKYIHWYLQQLISGAHFITATRERKALKNNNFPFEWGVKNYIATYLPPHTAIRLERKEYNRIVRHRDINPEFITSLRGREWEGIRKVIINKLNDILHFNTMQYGLEELLRFADRNSMAHGREVRLPFLNHDLVQFIFSLPAHFKIHDGWIKWLLRKTMENKLPDKIVWRTDKVGYEPPQEQWMQDTTLQEYIQEAKRKLVNYGILQQKALNKKIVPLPAYHSANYDWRYLCAATTLF
jgi:asparagine synthase (glutamine-hydrolysing)